MLVHQRFSQAAWDQAPRYEPLDVPDVLLPVDFDRLRGMAAQAEADDAFLADPAGVLAITPVFFGRLPAAFYRLESPPSALAAEHAPTGDETLVVLSGMLQVIDDAEYRKRRADPRQIFGEGEVARLRGDSRLHIQAVSKINRARCLALAIFHDSNLDLTPHGIPILGASTPG